MQTDYDFLFDAVEENKELILAAERKIWGNPEPGYREWKTHAFLKEQYEKLGYTLHEAGDIPGFYTDIDTGKPGPKIAVFGELDSLIVSDHPECDKTTGAVHACGHNCQSAALLGVAAALKKPGALDGLSGSIRLVAVPAEEGIEVEYRRELIKKGTIKYIAGKQEFLYRGYLDGVDVAFMVHTSVDKDIVFSGSAGSNGCIVKTAVFKGKSAHAGGSPHLGVNALYAATNAISIANALRETFTEKEFVRFHPIITNGGEAVNAIPETVTVESYIRAATMSSMIKQNEKLNRAFAGAAAAMGCELELHDMHGYAPRRNDGGVNEACRFVAEKLVSEKEIEFSDYFSKGCSDLGDITMVMPAADIDCAGATGTPHSSSYRIADSYKACVMSAKLQVGSLAHMLENGAAVAKDIIKNKNVAYNSKEEYFAAVDNLTADIDAVKYNKDGTVTLSYKK